MLCSAPWRSSSAAATKSPGMKRRLPGDKLTGRGVDSLGGSDVGNDGGFVLGFGVLKRKMRTKVVIKLKVYYQSKYLYTYCG